MPKVSKAKVNADADTGVISYDFTNGQHLEVALKDIPKETLKFFTLRGVGEAIRDTYAGVKDPDQAADVAGRKIEAILAGKTTIRISGGGGPRTTMLAEALSKVTGKSVEECQVKISELSDEQVADLKSRARVQVAMAEIRAERAKAKMKGLKAEAAEEEAPLPGF